MPNPLGISQARPSVAAASGIARQQPPAANPLLNKQPPSAARSPLSRQPPPTANPLLDRQPQPAVNPLLNRQPPPTANTPSSRSTSSSGVQQNGPDLVGSYWARGDIPIGPRTGNVGQRSPSGGFTTRSSAGGVTTVSGTSMQWRPASAASGVNATPLGNRPQPIINTGLQVNWYRYNLLRCSNEEAIEPSQSKFDYFHSLDVSVMILGTLHDSRGRPHCVHLESYSPSTTGSLTNFSTFPSFRMSCANPSCLPSWSSSATQS